MFRFVLIALFILSNSCFAQITKSVSDAENPRTILWKISGKDCKQPSYLLGTCHALRAEWLYTFPEVKAVVENCDHLITESLEEKHKEKIKKPDAVMLKAVDVMTPDQYKTLDSFFVARVGEGIKNNPEAEEMHVKAMTRAILQTLMVDDSGQGIGLIMDSDLYQFYRQKKKTTSALEHQDDFDFDSTNLDKAKLEMAKFVAAVKLGNNPAWNRSDTTKAAGQFINSYKKMKLGYRLTESDPDNETGTGGTVQERNNNWMPEILNQISLDRSGLIAVGFGHLQYKTGLIARLRERGYTVEPVALTSSK